MADDWKSIRAERYRAEQPGTLGQGSGRPAAKPGSQHIGSAASCKKQGTWQLQISTKQAALAGLLVVLAMAVSVQLRQRRENTGLNCSDTEPDARMRPAHAHRAYILGKLDFVQLYSSRQRASTHHERLSHTLSGVAGSQGWSAESEVYKGGITRCATTQYAMTTYLCAKAIADTDQNLPSIRSPAALRNYISLLDSIVQDGDDDTCTLWPELVLRFNIHEETDPSLGHTFVIHLLPEGGAQVYQSFITHYTLRSYLSSHGPLDAPGLAAFIDNMEAVTNATAWGPREDAAYKANFLVSLGAGSKVTVGVSTPHTGKAPLRRGPGKAIVMSAEPACLVVPWDAPSDKAAHAARALPPVAGAAYTPVD